MDLPLWVREQADIVTWQRSIRPSFSNFFIYLLSILLVSVVSLVSVISFQWSRFAFFSCLACFGGFVSLFRVLVHAFYSWEESAKKSHINNLIRLSIELII